MDIKVKPIQIRLPQEVENSLREVAHLTKRTLNSVVIDSLKNYLPVVDDDKSDHYQKTLQLQLTLTLELSSLLNRQIMDSCDMEDRADSEEFKYRQKRINDIFKRLAIEQHKALKQLHHFGLEQ